MIVALTHAVGAGLGECELTFVDRLAIDVARATRQHAAYRATLATLGAAVTHVDVSPDHPDAVFVEDAVVVLDELAIATSMGAASRRGEVERLLPVIESHRDVVRLGPRGTLEGGDVLRVARTLFVGDSARTDAAGIEALRALVTPHGYRVVGVPVRGCLHLKTACTALPGGVVLLNPEWVDPAAFDGFEVVPVDPDEPFGANTLSLGGAVVMSESHPRTIRRVRARGYDVVPVAIDELEKAEAGVTCLSVVFAAADRAR